MSDTVSFAFVRPTRSPFLMYQYAICQPCWPCCFGGCSDGLLFPRIKRRLSVSAAALLARFKARPRCLLVVACGVVNTGYLRCDTGVGFSERRGVFCILLWRVFVESPGGEWCEIGWLMSSGPGAT